MTTPRLHTAPLVILGLALAASPAWAEQVRPRAEAPPTGGAKTSRTRPAPGAPMRPPLPANALPWAQDATAHRGHNGRRITVNCPAGGIAGSVWGTSTYTDDSSICTAAVHAGHITLARGGRVTIQIRSGRGSYRGSKAHGITSQRYGKWSGSFIVLGAVPGKRVPTTPSGVQRIGWHDSAAKFRGRQGLQRMFRCPPSTGFGSVWGDGVYTDDSSICTAAVHAGTITARGGGVVIIEIAPGARSYRGVMSNGVRSSSWGSWTGSFIVVGGRRAVPPVRVGPTVLRWSDTAVAHRGNPGTQLTFACPAGGRPGTVWGSDIYTDDSSICTAAVHDGRITAHGGGQVTIEIRPGEPKYASRTRNGVTTQRWAKWSGSFVFVP